MVRYHYALVDDLVSREEFDRLIEKKIADCGNLADETTAALLVVKDLGRSHVKIRGLRGKSSLFCFYAKIIAFSGVREFDRPEGEKGLVARLTVADETGQVELVFWDEQAAALEETFEIGDVVEIIGRHGKSIREIMPLNLRKTCVDIDCVMEVKERKPPERTDLHLLVISLGQPRPFTRRDGTGGEMVSGLVGDTNGTARLICWEPALLSGISPGMAVSVTGALTKEGDYGGREIVCDEETFITPAENAPEIPVTSLDNIAPETSCTVRGTITKILPAKPFTKRDGTTSFVRNLRFSDGTADLPLVLWDAEAKRTLLPGETIMLYNAYTKLGRSGEIEVSLGRGGALTVIPDKEEPVRIEGWILHVTEGVVITNQEGSWLVETCLPHGSHVIMTGRASGKRVFCESEEEVKEDLEGLKNEVSSFIRSFS
ncbi:OB-fold nucleic acid binding domain-containing protein [Methanospirillum hungatei]|uniref:OB-fold nucleic acid binding domain-containing protein n=1 Tax=Methanospirillum hungatei TaxID=2203 RepID=UPI0026ED5296|nr:OB-fold nucleic acid binding domain-containing protein [Methanospirillum hungatei]MCA1915046.1 nucleic acid-binding protein [Methanospirillum hungatei]